MGTVVSLYPKIRFEVAGISIPAELTFRFVSPGSDSEVIEACKGADCLLTTSTATKISARILENIPDIKLIQCTGAGFDHIDLATATRLGIPVANAPGQNLVAVAELTIGFIIALQRQLLMADREIKAGNFTACRANLVRKGVRQVSDSKIGLVGFGAIGRHVAKLAGMLGGSISYYDVYRPSPEIEAELKVDYKDLDDLLATSEIISTHVPLNDQTRNLIGKRELALMPAGSLLINTARGEILDQAALAEALEMGHLGGAAIDTLSPEPPGPNHPLLNLSPEASKRLLVTPHIAGATVGSNKKMIRMGLDNMMQVVRGEPVLTAVNGITRREK
jgi:phosphoglycerate dehydrogenase-like enzyme